MFKKIWGAVKPIGKALFKATPLSGVVNEFKQAKDEKDWLKFAAYVLGGLAMWGFITGKFTFEQLTDLLEVLLG